MRSFSDVNILIAALLVLTVCVLWNFQPVYDMARWVVQSGLSLLLADARFIRNVV